MIQTHKRSFARLLVLCSTAAATAGFVTGSTHMLTGSVSHANIGDGRGVNVEHAQQLKLFSSFKIIPQDLARRGAYQYDPDYDIEKVLADAAEESIEEEELHSAPDILPLYPRHICRGLDESSAIRSLCIRRLRTMQ